jgi:hypothetical protein
MPERSARTLGSRRQACQGGRGPGEFTQARGRVKDNVNMA